jgi:hypothetical protein
VEAAENGRIDVEQQEIMSFHVLKKVFDYKVYVSHKILDIFGVW